MLAHTSLARALDSEEGGVFSVRGSIPMTQAVQARKRGERSGSLHHWCCWGSWRTGEVSEPLLQGVVGHAVDFILCFYLAFA